MNEGILHVIEQLGIAHKAALEVIAVQHDEIERLKKILAERTV